MSLHWLDVVTHQSWCALHVGIVRLAVQVTVNAKKTEVVGLTDAVLKIRLQAQPIEGKANLALTQFVAAQLGVPKKAVTVTHGLIGKRKLIAVEGCPFNLEQVVEILLRGVSPAPGQSR